MPQSGALPLAILGTGRYVPSGGVDSTDFDARWSLPPGTIERECGVRRRYHASRREGSAFMGARAVEAALAAAGVAAADLDAVVSTSSVMQQAIPCLASHIQTELGLGRSGIPAFDVNATCLGFLAGLDLVAAGLAVDRYRTVAVVASEMASVGLDPDDRATAPLFGDGAAAVIVTRTPEGSTSRLLAAGLATYGEGGAACQLRMGGTAYPAHAALPHGGFFEMDGPALYRLARRYLPRFTRDLLARAGTTLDDLACVVPHQASGPALDHMVAALGLPEGRVVRILSEYGNQVAASLPHALHAARDAGQITRGDRVLLLGTGAGMAVGGAVLVY